MSNGRKRRIVSESSAGQTIEVVTKGQVLCGRYELGREIARGGMGIVYEATDRELEGSPVAIKVLPPELSTSEKYKIRLRKEAIAAMKLTHPAILRLHSFESDGDIVFLIMELLTGPNLEQATIDPPYLPLEEVMDIAKQVCPALDYAHKNGVIHRDIKPANLIYTGEGEDRVVKVTDFGIAFVVKDSISRVSGMESAGTLLYVSPEQLQGNKPGPQADQYSLATTFYELISGETPFSGAGISYQVINATPRPLQDVPQHISDAIDRALAKNPEDRFSSCTEFLEALEGKIPATASTTQKGKNKSHSGYTRLLFFFAILVLLAFGGYQKYMKKPRVLKDWRPTATATVNVPTSPPLSSAKPSVTPSLVPQPTVAPSYTPPPTKAPPVPTLAVLPTPKVAEQKILPVNVTLSSVPSGAKVYRIGDKDGGSLQGDTEEPLELLLMPGIHSFNFVLKGYREERKNIFIPVGTKTMAPVEVELSKPGANLSLTLSVPDSEVTVNGQVVPSDKLSAYFVPIGKQIIKASKKGYFDDVLVIEVTDGENLSLTLKPKLKPKGPIKGENYTNTLNMNFVWLPPGKFKMGGRRQDSPDEVPVRTVSIRKGFWIGKYEVTNREYKLFSKVLPSRSRQDNRPVERVSWYSAKLYCEKLTASERKKGELPSDYVYRLPSEAQWEYAARGGTQKQYGDISEMWCEDNSRGRTHEVGKRKANGFGLHDTLGNVWEWTLDYWHSSYRGAPKDGSAWIKGGDSSYRSLRGGSWDFPKRKCRYSIRLKDVPSRNQEDVGFRIVIAKIK